MPSTEGARQFTPLTPQEIKSSAQALVIIGGPWCPPCNEARAAGVYSGFAKIAGQHRIPFGELTIPSQGNLTLALIRKEQDATEPGRVDLDLEHSTTYQQLEANYQAFRNRYDSAVTLGSVDDDLRRLEGRWEGMMNGVRAGETDLTRFLAQIGVDVVPTLVYFENGQPVSYLQMPGESEKTAFVTADRFTRRIISLGKEDTVALDGDAFAALDANLPTRR
ncbi:MAG: hypothetical protein KGL95_05675, partial [Patescibacteria group bacterium]|nr:hypothetical protein [Patescibacteria group bacterium]